MVEGKSNYLTANVNQLFQTVLCNGLKSHTCVPTATCIIAVNTAMLTVCLSEFANCT